MGSGFRTKTRFFVYNNKNKTLVLIHGTKEKMDKKVKEMALAMADNPEKIGYFAVLSKTAGKNRNTTRCMVYCYQIW